MTVSENPLVKELMALVEERDRLSQELKAAKQQIELLEENAVDVRIQEPEYDMGDFVDNLVSIPRPQKYNLTITYKNKTSTFDGWQYRIQM